MQQKLFDILLDQGELDWKNIIYDLVKSEQMDPWDIDLKVLTQKFIQVIKDLQEQDFKIPGKILLAAAILLKIKATHLIDNDITKLDQLINQTDEDVEEELFDEIEVARHRKEKQEYKLIPRNPQPRNRKVSVNDLVEALQRAMSTKKKILAKQRPVKFTHHLGKKIDIMEVIRDIYHKINYYSDKDNGKITFTRLLPPKAGKQEKVFTFLPLLHLENQHKIETEQKKHFDEIQIQLLKKGKGKKVA